MRSVIAIALLVGLCNAYPQLNRRVTNSTDTPDIIFDPPGSGEAINITAILADDTPSIADSLGLSKLTAEDITYVYLTGAIMTEGTNGNLNRREDEYTGEATPARWVALDMDKWLDGWMSSTNLPRQNGKKLSDSTQFVKDFWLSSGEENTFACGDLQVTSCTALARPKSAYDGIASDDVVRSYWARLAIANWHNDIAKSYQITSSVSESSYGDIRTIREAFQFPDATKPGDPMDAILGALALVAVFVPAIAPAVGVIGGVYAMTKAVGKRDLEIEGPDMSLVPRLTLPEDDEPTPVHLLPRQSSLNDLPADASSDVIAIKDTLQRVRAATEVVKQAANNNVLNPAVAAESVAAQANKELQEQVSKVRSNSAPAKDLQFIKQAAAQSDESSRKASTIVSLMRESAGASEKGTLDKLGSANVKDLQEKVSKLEADYKNQQDAIDKLNGKVFKDPTTLENVNKKLKTAGDALEKGAKFITALKAMKPSLGSSNIDGWLAFDARIRNALSAYQESISNTWTLNWQSFYGKSSASPTDANVQIAVPGMQEILRNGAYFTSGQQVNVDLQKRAYRSFFQKVILNEVLKSQSVYLWREIHGGQDTCQSATNEYIDLKWGSKGTFSCTKTERTDWLLTFARRPFANDDASPNEWATSNVFGDFTLLRPKAEGNKPIVATKNNWYQVNQAAVTTFNTENLKKVMLDDISIEDIYRESESCYNSYTNPWTMGKPPTRDELYRPMVVDKMNPLANAKTLPKCLFNLPVFKSGEPSLNNWCRANIGSRRVPADSRAYSPDNKPCDERFKWGVLADTMVCGSTFGNWGPGPARDVWPGCEKHDKGAIKIDQIW